MSRSSVKVTRLARLTHLPAQAGVIATTIAALAFSAGPTPAADSPSQASNMDGSSPETAARTDGFAAVRHEIREGRYAAALAVLRKIPAPAGATLFQKLLLEADIAMRRGEPERAHEIYVQAEGQAGDAPDADLGQVRADLLSGEFRRASAFALLVSGEHSDSMDALALGAFIEERAGQTERALDFLNKTRTEHPNSVPLLGATAEILIDRGRASEAAGMLDEWIGGHLPQPAVFALRARAAAVLGDSSAAQLWRTRAARLYARAGETFLARTSGGSREGFVDESTMPLVTGRQGSEGDWRPPCFEPFPIQTGRGGNGFVIDNGSRVVTLSAIVAGTHGPIYVRNGTGHVRRARIERADGSSGLTTLRLDIPFESRWSITREQFTSPVPGRPASVVGFGVVDPHEASWPAVTSGFAIRPRGQGPFRVSADLPAAAAGSAVFDPRGRLIGVIALRGEPASEDAQLIPASALESLPQDQTATAARPGASTSAPVEVGSAKELLERAQGAVVVVLAPTT